MDAAVEDRARYYPYEVELGEDPGKLVLNMGPQHPSTHGVMRLVLELDGETVVRATPVVGYLHTGIEKTMEDKLYQQAVTLTDRMDYLAPLSNNLVYVLAAEKLLDVEVPERVQDIRVLLTELTRLNSHLVWLGTHANDIGAVTMLLFTFRERERILDIFEEITGQRMMTSYFRIGGLSADLPESGIREEIKGFLDDFPSKIEEYDILLKENPIWLRRTVGVCPISREDAIDYGLTGPLLRACGVEHDTRRSEPYSGYDRYDFDIPTQTEGDVYARYMVRMEEMRQSTRLCRQALQKIPDKGPWHVEDHKLFPPERSKLGTSMEAVIHHFKLYTDGFSPPKGAVYQAIESPKGEIGCYLVSDGSNKPWRVRFRPPCFVNLQAFPRMVEGQLLSDVVAAIGSIDIVLGEVDR
jgi:NADH-quinone oxidoreductase subunit D